MILRDINIQTERMSNAIPYVTIEKILYRTFFKIQSCAYLSGYQLVDHTHTETKNIQTAHFNLLERYQSLRGG